MDCNRLDVTFEDIAGMEGVKRSVQEIVSEPLDFPPELFPVSDVLRGTPSFLSFLPRCYVAVV